ncbi:MAG: hypothetical protein NTU53_21860 [Planctomycetota bacterium]|nr:hypothetical protein [Planctomycetota bacterium]
MIHDIVRRAFLAVRDGRASEYVISHPELNARFIERCRAELGGADTTQAEMNRCLNNLRKQGQLSKYPTTRRKQPDPQRQKYEHLVLNAARLIERQYSTTIDEIVCNPATRTEFDTLMQMLYPDISLFEARYTVLSLRKSSRLKPEPLNRFLAATGAAILPIRKVEASLSSVPTRPGLYLFFDETMTLYIGEADSLQRRIGDHCSTWTFRELVRLISQGKRSEAFLAYYVLTQETGKRTLRDAETELIRSRNPEHNRSGASRHGDES